MAKTLAFAAAEQGMCGGQYLDTSKEGLPVTEAELYEIHRLKTERCSAPRASWACSARRFHGAGVGAEKYAR